MGADGHIVIARRADYDANVSVPPNWMGLYTGEFLGIDCVWGYWGDNLDGGNYLSPEDWNERWGDTSRWKRIWTGDTFRDTTPQERADLKLAAEWFDANAEQHEVWT